MPATPKVPQDHKKKSTKAKSSKPKPTEVKTSGWGQQSTGDLLELPSGNVVRCLRPGVQGLIKAGVLESLDALTGIVQSETIPKAEGKPVVDAQKILEDPKRLTSMLEMMDNVVIAVVTEPRVWPTPVVPAADAENGVLAHDLRDPDKAYIDLIDPDDKTFIMNYAFGGSRDLTDFREATQEIVASIHNGQTDGDSSQ